MIRTRIAPSPTGDLHIGHMRTILFDYALAKQNNGQFIVRIEDTDRERFVEGSMDRTLDVIKAYGLDWNEGPRVGGKFAPYIQSERLDLYKKYAQELIDKDLAYYCFMNEEETKELQEKSRLEGKKLRSPYRNSTAEEIKQLLASGKPHVIRLKVTEDKIISFEDAILGKVSYNTNEVDDQVLIKTDGFPTYHMAVVVDDHLMEITHVLRGNDWLPSTPKHIMLYEAFGWELPVFAHLPNLKEKGENKKLSKRFGAVFAIQFLQDGYLPDAMLNFLMLLGFSFPEDRVHGQAEREIFTLEEFVNKFSLDRVQQTAMVAFDREKLLWFNKQYIKNKSKEELTEIFNKWLKEYSADKELINIFEEDYKNGGLKDKVELVKERAGTLLEIAQSLMFFYKRPENIDWNIKQLESFKDKLPAIKERIKIVIENLPEDSSTWTNDSWAADMKKISEEFGIKGGDSFMVLRVAVVGTPFSPPLFESLQLMSKQEILSRLNN